MEQSNELTEKNGDDAKVGKKRKRRIIKRVVIGLLAFIVAVPLVFFIFNRVSLSVEQGRIVPKGEMVEVNGRLMHVYIEGENEDAPLLVFLSAFGTTAPVYDFKPLYSLLSGEYRIAVVERPGYGYSEMTDAPRDIDTVLSETREALSLVGETGPYVLLPHSISGPEAIRWAQKYPEEVLGIIGLDMGITTVYIDYADMILEFHGMSLIRALISMGVHRVPGFMYVNDLSLTEEEYEQTRLLTYRNMLNSTMMRELESIYDNARTIEQDDIPNVPILLLISEWQDELIEEQLDDPVPMIWYQTEYARRLGGSYELLDAGHYLHHYISPELAVIIKEFVDYNLE